MRKHIHHIIPRHMGGTDDPDNLMEVTIEEHAELHRQLYEQHGRWQDHVAWKCLSGQISHYEATIEAIKRTQTGRKHSPEMIAKKVAKQKGQKRSLETRQKIAKGNTGRTQSEEVRKKIGSYHKGKKLSEEHKKILKETHLNKPKSEEQRKKMSESAKKIWALRKGSYSNAVQ